MAATPPDVPLLAVRDLAITLATERGRVRAVHDLSFTLQRGETLGLIGESGCGKSLTALALMGLLPEGAGIEGSLQLAGQELVGLPEPDWCRLRGNRVAMVFQEPMTALNPLHRGLTRRAARHRSIALLERVGIPEPAQRVDSFPHQFSGGQRQRIMIAMALACEPDVLLADEPTTALDVTVQQQILALIGELVAERGMALILISHDLALVAQNVQRLLVMYGGEVVEQGLAREVFAHPAHLYTRGLLAARPSLAQRLHGHLSDRLPTIAGSVPELLAMPPGCPFAGRCAFTEAACASEVPPVVTLSPTHRLRCRRADAVHRVQRRHRLLEDHGDARAAHAPPAAVGQADELLARQLEAAADGGVVGRQAHQRQRCHRLAAAGFADQAQRVAALQREAHVAHGRRAAAVGAQLDAQVLGLQQRHGVSRAAGW